jgi:acetate---CoA ligase (ADP-forming)
MNIAPSNFEQQSQWGEALFNPGRVALIGASSKAAKLGNLVMRNLLDGFAGEILPIHPGEKEILGRRVYPSLRDVPDPVDLALVAVPTDAVLSAIEDCAHVRAKVAIILTGGFAETGDEGRALQKRVSAAAQAGGVRLIGPNCFGVINAHAHLNGSIGIGLPAAGGVSLFTQSGAYGMAAFSRSKEEGIGFAKVIAPGNTADLDEAEIIAYLGADAETRVIAMLLESIGDGDAFLKAARTVTPVKPVIVLKTGRNKMAQRAAASHTAALAGDYRITSAALRQAGVRLVEDGLTLLDVAAALCSQPPLRGNRVAIITNSGGTGVELTDLLEDQGLVVPQLSSALQSTIRPSIPAYGSAANPVDVTTDWPRFAQMYGETLKVLAASDEVDAIVPVLLQRSALMPEVAARIVAEQENARREGNQKPIHVCWVGPEGAEENRRRLLSAGIPCHPWTVRTASILASSHVVRVRDGRDLVPPLPAPTTANGDGWVDLETTFRLLSDAGVNFAPWRIAEGADEVDAAASRIGFPCVLKAIRPTLLHKSEAGAVKIGIADAAQARAAVHDFESRLGAGPILVQRQAAPGLELVVGASRDPHFGPAILFGLGGIWIEALNDVSVRMAPFTQEEAASMFDELRGRTLLDGARGCVPVDRSALAQMLAGLSQWVARASWLTELDLNPIIVDGSRFTAVDARLRIKRATSAEPPR